MGENTLLDKLIDMDDVSGLANKSGNFANFLTVSRKFGFTCVYIFHTIYLTRKDWQMILSQTKNCNIFPGCIQATSVIQILSSYCNRYMYEYIPHKDLWLNQLYFDILNSDKKQCLAIDTGDVKDLGSAKFRTRPDNNNEQVCYYNRDKKDKAFNLRKKTSTANKIIFSIVNLIDRSNKKEDICFEMNHELREFSNGIFQSEPRIRRASESDTDRKTINDQQQQQQRQQKQQQQQQQHWQQQQKQTQRFGRRVSKKPRFLSG